MAKGDKPIEPPNIKVSTHTTTESRIIFGKDPPPDYVPLQPPEPPPKGTYPKKPQYWQFRGTKFAGPINSMALIGTLVISGVSVAIFFLSDFPERAMNKLGYPKDRTQMIEDNWENNQLYLKMMMNFQEYDVNQIKGTIKKKNIKPERWDIREVDQRMSNFNAYNPR